jgi:hypothetical protein
LGIMASGLARQIQHLHHRLGRLYVTESARQGVGKSVVHLIRWIAGSVEWPCGVDSPSLAGRSDSARPVSNATRQAKE